MRVEILKPQVEKKNNEKRRAEKPLSKEIFSDHRDMTLKKKKSYFIQQDPVGFVLHAAVNVSLINSPSSPVSLPLSIPALLLTVDHLLFIVVPSSCMSSDAKC